MSITHFCKQCAQPIYGRYLTAMGADWHPEHFRCSVCQQPITDSRFYVHDGQPCHPTCFADNIAPRCVICNKPLTSRYHANYWGDTFCTDHTETLAPCNYCGRLVPHATKKTRRRSIDDIRCNICASTAIEHTPQAQHLLPPLIAWLEQQGVRFRHKNFHLELLDRTDFLSREGGRRDPLGLTTSTRHMRNRRVDHAVVDSIAILKGLPATLFEGVCVHELGHVWLVQHSIVNLPIVDEEGFCEWLAHRHYLAIGSKADHFYAQRIAENSSPIYGDGFRKLKRLEDRVGFDQITQSLLRKKKLPL
ncbi:MAG: protein DA1 [Anaerolineae bacterium]|nr:protein DA1 [Anaerolineae bacterium]